jgi:hypothetical protein
VGLDLSDAKDALAVGAGKPFTFALWVRTENWVANAGSFARGSHIGGGFERSFTISPSRANGPHRPGGVGSDGSLLGGG